MHKNKISISYKMATRLNYAPYHKEQFKPLDSIIASEILNKFDESKK